MGLFLEWVAFKASTPQARDEVLATMGGHGYTALPESDGWTWMRAGRKAYEFEIYEFVLSLCPHCGGPAFAGCVLDSDVAVLAGGAPGDVGFIFAINADADEEWWSVAWRAPEQRRNAAASLERWSSTYAPKTVSAEHLLARMPGHGNTQPPPDLAEDDRFFAPGDDLWTNTDDDVGGEWTFAEDGVRLLFRLLGFPDFDEKLLTRNE